MVKRFGAILVALTCAALLPARLSAQAASGIAGVVRDTSGGVMPGVTVEASSPALIEKVRSVVTDADGQYKIIDLRPGAYTVTFSLAGFSTVKRDGIELSAGFTASGQRRTCGSAGCEETITVSGQSPMVDTQNVVQQKVMTQGAAAVGAEQPKQLRGADAGRVDVQPTSAAATAATPAPRSRFTAGEGGDTRRLDRRHALELDGSRQRRHRLLLRSDRRRGDRHSARRQLGGVRARRRPGEPDSEGRRQSLQRLRLRRLHEQQLEQLRRFPTICKARGLPTIGAVDYVYDYSGSLGGPIIQDKLWFFTAQRWWGNSTFVPGLYYNKDTSAWIYQPDLIAAGRQRQHQPPPQRARLRGRRRRSTSSICRGTRSRTASATAA